MRAGASSEAKNVLVCTRTHSEFAWYEFDQLRPMAKALKYVLSKSKHS